MHIGILGARSSVIKQPFLGGLESFTYNYVMDLSKHHMVTIFAHPDSEFDQSVTFIPYPKLLDHNVIGKLEKSSSYRRLSEDMDVYFALNKLKELGCDIIHNHMMDETPLKMQKELAIPMVTTFHQNSNRTEYLAGVIFNRLNGGEEYSHYVAISQYSKSDWLPHTPKISLIHNAINIDQREYHELASEENYYSWVGRILEEKGLSEAVQIAIKSGIKLKIGGPIQNQNYFDENVEPFLSEKITYEGSLNHQQVNKLIGESVGFLFTPIRQETFGLVLIEALASGTPVFAYASGASPEIIINTVGCVVTQGNQQALIDAIKSANIDRTACRKHVEDNYTWSHTMDKYLKLYDTILSTEKQ